MTLCVDKWGELRLAPFAYNRVVMRVERPIWLVGMMGAGKSTVGLALAKRLSLTFVDADSEMESRAGRTISEIFARQGEAAFRVLEREFIDEVSRTPAVVALGGGAIAQPGRVEELKRLGVLVYLRARPESLLARIGDARSRPLLDALGPRERRARLCELLKEREASYARAAIQVDTDDLAPAAVVTRIVEELERSAEVGRAKGQ